MFTPDLFKKLKPILGRQIEPLEAIYLAGDDESIVNPEKIYAFEINPLLPDVILIEGG